VDTKNNPGRDQRTDIAISMTPSNENHHMPHVFLFLDLLITFIAYLYLTMMGCSRSAEDASEHSIQCLSIIEYAEKTMTIGS